MRIDTLKVEYVKHIPHELEQGIIYFSNEFNTAIHLCACGCGNQTVTPFGVDGWHYFDDNGKLTLEPSIGNFSFPCKSHYFIRGGRVEWC